MSKELADSKTGSPPPTQETSGEIKSNPSVADALVGASGKGKGKGGKGKGKAIGGDIEEGENGGKGRGKVIGGGKGIGKARRHHRTTISDAIKGVTKGSIRRLCRRAGIKRINGNVYDRTKSGLVRPFLMKILTDSITFAEHARRKTVKPMDVVYALKHNNRGLYGFDNK